MATDLRNELRRHVDSLTSTLADELESLIERRAVDLVAEQLGIRNGAGRTRTPRRRTGKVGPRASNGDTGARILAYVKAHPGTRSEHVRAALKLGKGQWVYNLGKLLSAKQLTRKGVKRASTLHPR